MFNEHDLKADCYVRQNLSEIKEECIKINVEWTREGRILTQELYSPFNEGREQDHYDFFQDFESNTELKSTLLTLGGVDKDDQANWTLGRYNVVKEIKKGIPLQEVGEFTIYIINLPTTEPTQVTMNDANCEAYPLPDMADNPYNGIQFGLRWECNQIPKKVFWLPVFAKCPNGKMDQLEYQLGHLSPKNNTFLKTLFRKYIEDFKIITDANTFNMKLGLDTRTTDKLEEDVPDNTFIFYVGTFFTT
jgi:hypothetical protein